MPRTRRLSSRTTARRKEKWRPRWNKRWQTFGSARFTSDSKPRALPIEIGRGGQSFGQSSEVINIIIFEVRQMKRLVSVLMLLAFAVLPLGAFADDGMWTFDNPPRKQWKERYNFE